MPRKRGSKAQPERTSFAVSTELLERLRLARVITGRRQQEIAAAAIAKYLDALGIPRTLPKLKEQR
jgi:hypothetical protein